MEAPYRYSSTRLPRDVSHLVKRSDLDALLRERALATSTVLPAVLARARRVLSAAAATR